MWRSATAIDSFSIGEERKRGWRSDVRGSLPRADHGTVWERIDSVDAFSVGNEQGETDSSEEHDVCGLIPGTGDELR